MGVDPNNVRALGHFQVHDVDGGHAGSGDENYVKLETNLEGEPIRFSLHEDLSNIVSSASLTMLNARIDELGEIQEGVLGPTPTEEDMEQWGTLVERASIEPNQLVYVTETVNEESCTTYWRVVSAVSYLSDEGVPYCDVELESMPQIAIDTAVDPKEMGSADTALFVISRVYLDSVRLYEDKYATDEGYQFEDEVESILSQTGMRQVDNCDEWAAIFLDYLSGKGLDFSGSITGLERMPCYKVYNYGISLWQVVEELLAINELNARFKRDLSLITWSTDEIGFGETIDVGDFGTGMKISYSKEGVCSRAQVSGYVGKKDDFGFWLPFEQQETPVEVTSQFGYNILNGQTVDLPVTVPPDLLLEDEEQLKAYGRKELYKTALAARGISIDSDSIPLAAEVGMKATGGSQLAGTTTMVITSLSRTTDAQQKTCQTSLTGVALEFAGAGSDGAIDNSDSWT